ncbi:MAG: YeeE/YedE thiosulfate transporter family protein [Cyclobacteriaceae bacterium]
MKNIKFLFVGIIFGIVLTKSEVISWYRIYEMFRFESFHMYGVIGSAVILGIVLVQSIKRFKLRDIAGNPIVIQEKAKLFWPPLIGGIIFGLGWALTGACPGPIYILIGNGFLSFIVVFLSAVAGTFVYGLVMQYLPRK